MACNCCDRQEKCKNELRETELGNLNWVTGIDENGCKRYELFNHLVSRFQFGGTGGIGGQSIEDALNTPGIPQYSLQGAYLGNWYPR